MSGRHPFLTTQRTLGPGAVLRRGRLAPYRAVEPGTGEPHLVRDDFGATAPGGSKTGPGRPLFCIDFILTSRSLRAEEATVIFTDQPVSDHIGLRATLVDDARGVDPGQRSTVDDARGVDPGQRSTVGDARGAGPGQRSTVPA